MPPDVKPCARMLSSIPSEGIDNHTGKDPSAGFGATEGIAVAFGIGNDDIGVYTTVVATGCGSSDDVGKGIPSVRVLEHAQTVPITSAHTQAIASGRRISADAPCDE